MVTPHRMSWMSGKSSSATNPWAVSQSRAVPLKMMSSTATIRNSENTTISTMEIARKRSQLPLRSRWWASLSPDRMPLMLLDA